MTPGIFLVLDVLLVNTVPDAGGSGIHGPSVQPVKHEETETPATTVSGYEEALEKIRRERGVYDPQTGEMLVSIGNMYQEQGQHQAAIDVFEQALQVAKVNLGLHHPDLIKIIENLISSNLAINDRAALRKYFEYMLWVYRRNYGDNDARLVPVINEIGQWYFNLYNLSPLGKGLEPLVAADEIYQKALELEFTRDQIDERVAILYKRAVVNYHLAEEIMDHKVSHRELRAAMIPHRRGSPYIHEQAVRQYYFDQSFFSAKRTINEIISLYESRLPEKAVEYARALVFKADWYAAQKRTWGINSHYQRAWDILEQNSADASTVNSIFGQPVPIENLPVPGEPEHEVAKDSYYVDALVDIPENGWPTNIRIINIMPGSEPSLYGRGRRAISAIRYRPRFEQGRPVATTDVELRYVFKYRDKPGWFHF